MVNTIQCLISLIHWKGIKWICTINILSRLSPQFTAMQHKKWAWTASHPTQRPVQLPSTVPTLPTSSVWGGLGGFSGSFGFPSSVGSFSSWMAKDLIWSRCRVNMSQQKESGRSNWAAGGRKSQCSASAWGWLRRSFVKILFYSFSAKIASQSLFLECKFKAFSGRIYQMSYSVFPANLWVRIWCSNKWFHTTKANYHQACPYPLLKPPWLIRNQWSMVNTFFHTLKWICTTNILFRQFTPLQQQNKWAWTASHPTQRPVQLPSTVPTLPTSSVWGGLGGFSGSFGFPSSVGSFSSWMAKDLIWSRCRVNMSQQKESGRSNWAAGGRKSQCSASAWGWR